VNGFRHFELRGAMLVAADHAAFEQAAGAEDVLHRRRRSAIAVAVLRRSRRLFAEILFVSLFAYALFELRRWRVIFQRSVNTLARNDRFRVVGLLSFS